jgi:hypothetical protein
MPALARLVVSGGVMGGEELQLLVSALEASPDLQVRAWGPLGLVLLPICAARSTLPPALGMVFQRNCTRRLHRTSSYYDDAVHSS